MKKTLFFAVLFLGMISLKAQEIHFGARVAGSLTNLKIVAVDSDAISDAAEDNSKTTSKVGFELGGIAEIMLNDQIAVAPEFNIATAGGIMKGKDMDGYWTDTISLTYIQVPFMLKYYLNENINVNAGPQVGLLMTATDFFQQEGYTDLDNLKPKLKTTDFGINLGAGYKMENGLFFDLRYYMGLTGLLANTHWENLKNRGLKFGVGYFFN